MGFPILLKHVLYNDYLLKPDIKITAYKKEKPVLHRGCYCQVMWRIADLIHLDIARMENTDTFDESVLCLYKITVDTKNILYTMKYNEKTYKFQTIKKEIKENTTQIVDTVFLRCR